MSNLNIPETEYSEARAFWKSRFALMDKSETDTKHNHLLTGEVHPFFHRELVLSDEFKRRLMSITDDPLTAFGIITSMFSLLFNRYNASSHAVFMVPFLKGENNDNRTFPLLLQQEKDDTLQGYLNRSLQVIEDCFNYSAYPIEVLAKDELGWETISVSKILIISDELHSYHLNDSQFDIKININPDTYNIKFEYKPLAFPEYRAELIQGHLRQIENTFSDVSMLLAAIDILTKDEIKHLLSLNPKPEAKANKTLIDLFAETVRSSPDQTALYFEGNAVTYKELDVKSSKLASHLQLELGAQPGSTIALMMERSDLMIIGILGILKSGAAYVPVDPAYPKERIEYLLTASGAETLVTTSAFLFDIPFFKGNIFAIDIQLNDLPLVNEHFDVDDQSLAYIIFTSGSTGKPKGVEIIHASVFNYLNWAKEYYFHHNQDGGSFPLFTPVSFDLTITSIFIPLIRGKQIEIFGDKDAGEILRDIFSEKGRVDTLKLTPSHISLLAEIPEGNVNVRTLIVGGEALREDHVAIVKNKWPEIAIFNEYGPTEATVGCTVTEVNTGDITIGSPIANTAVYILDDDLRFLPAGAVGEIYIGGICLAKGYSQPEQTNLAFINSPFINGEKIYRTGDLGLWLENGTLKYMGRKDTQLKIRGYRIETGEIESIILENKGIKDVAVVPYFNKANNASLIAYYTSAGDALITIEEIELALAQKLPIYMLPSLIIRLEKLPLTPNFKVDRQKLSEMEIEGNSSDDYIAPVSDIEQTLVRIFSEVLGREKISISDNFFAIGGDSIIGIQIVSRANREGIMITLKQLFKQLTIAGLAMVAEKAEPVIAEQGPVSGNIELTPIHKWFFDQQLPQISHYNQSLILKVGAAFDPAIMEAALVKIIEHHDMLRMRVKLTNKNYEEYIPEYTAIVSNFSVKEFTGVPEPELQTLLLDDMAQLEAGLDIFNGPVLVARYYDLGEENESMLLLAIHHLVIDGVSWRILLDDLSVVYNQLLSIGESVSLPEKTASFKTWAAAALAHSSSAELVKELPFWISENRMEIAPFPVDMECSKEKNTVSNSLTYSNQLDEDATRNLISIVHKAYNTNVNDLLLAALVTAFNNYSGHRNLLIAMEGHGREDIFDKVDISRTIGWFTSIYPVLLELDDTNGLTSVITSLKEQLRGIPNNGVGYGMLKYGNSEDYIKTTLAYMPQPEIIFNYLGQSAQAIPSNSEWKISTLQTGSDQGGDAVRNYLIEINAIIIDDRLIIDWTYCPQIHNEDTIKRLAVDYVKALKELISHCLDADAGSYTPSDFPEAGLEQEQLDQLMSQFKFSD